MGGRYTETKIDADGSGDLLERREVSLDGDELPLTDTIADTPDAEFSVERVARDDGVPYVFVSVRNGNVARLETAFADDPTVREADQLEAWADHHLYRVELEADPAEVLEVCIDCGVDPTTMESSTHGFVTAIPADGESLEELEQLEAEQALDVGPGESERAELLSPTDD